MESSTSSTRIKPTVNTEVLDGSVLVHMLMPYKCETLDDYPEKVFLSHMLEKLEPIDRLDIIWYRYLPQSLQQATKKRRKQLSCASYINSFKSSLKLEQNKAKLLLFLAESIISVSTEGKQPYTTLENNILAARPTSSVSMI